MCVYACLFEATNHKLLELGSLVKGHCQSAVLMVRWRWREHGNLLVVCAAMDHDRQHKAAHRW